MRAATVVRPMKIEIRETETPTPTPRQVLVRLEGCGVCASNIPPWEGKPWFTYPLAAGGLGHEGWGRIEAVGSAVTGFVPGERVAMLSNNAYAEYDVAESEAVVKLPAQLDGEPFPGEPLGCAMNIFRRSGIRKGDTVAVVGAGFLGTLLIRLASKAGARVIAVSRRNYALEVAREMGAWKTISLENREQAIDEVKKTTGGNFCDVVIEATGKQSPLTTAGELTRERGRLVIAGYHQDGLRQINLQLWNWRGLDVINAHERDPRIYLEGMRLAIGAVQFGQIDPSPLYTHRLPLERLDEALTMTAERPDGFMKALILFSTIWPPFRAAS
ncbi:MAG: zinc-binding dehydrogenase [Verrucomicrobiota bacterium]